MQDQTKETFVLAQQEEIGHSQAHQEHDNQDQEPNPDLSRTEQADVAADNDGGGVYGPPQQALLLHRHSFVPPFPVSSTSTGTPTLQSPPITQTPLTNHEVYELIQQKNQQQQQQVTGTMMQNNPGNIMSPVSQGSFKQTKRQSLYIHQQNRGLERQASVIVGTPGFRERYGE